MNAKRYCPVNHILAHCHNGRWDASKTVSENVSLFNAECLAGMIETGEIEYSDLMQVGGDVLAAAIAKDIQRRQEA